MLQKKKKSRNEYKTINPRTVSLIASLRKEVTSLKKRDAAFRRSEKRYLAAHKAFCGKQHREIAYLRNMTARTSKDLQAIGTKLMEAYLDEGPYPPGPKLRKK